MLLCPCRGLPLSVGMGSGAVNVESYPDPHTLIKRVGGSFKIHPEAMQMYLLIFEMELLVSNWQLFSQETAAARELEGKAKNLNQMHSELKEQMMMMRIRETSLVSELNENRQKLMELETQVVIICNI